MTKKSETLKLSTPVTEVSIVISDSLKKKMRALQAVSDVDLNLVISDSVQDLLDDCLWVTVEQKVAMLLSQELGIPSFVKNETRMSLNTVFKQEENLELNQPRTYEQVSPWAKEVSSEIIEDGDENNFEQGIDLSYESSEGDEEERSVKGVSYDLDPDNDFEVENPLTEAVGKPMSEEDMEELVTADTATDKDHNELASRLGVNLSVIPSREVARRKDGNKGKGKVSEVGEASSEVRA